MKLRDLSAADALLEDLTSHRSLKSFSQTFPVPLHKNCFTMVRSPKAAGFHNIFCFPTWPTQNSYGSRSGAHSRLVPGSTSDHKCPFLAFHKQIWKGTLFTDSLAWAGHAQADPAQHISTPSLQKRVLLSAHESKLLRPCFSDLFPQGVRCNKCHVYRRPQTFAMANLKGLAIETPVFTIVPTYLDADLLSLAAALTSWFLASTGRRCHEATTTGKAQGQLVRDTRISDQSQERKCPTKRSGTPDPRFDRGNDY